MNALKLAESWKIYIDTFTDLCDIDKVPADKRRKLLLLLAGNKLRKLLAKLESDAEAPTQTLEQTVELLTRHFENRRTIQVTEPGSSNATVLPNLWSLTEAISLVCNVARNKQRNESA
jgi:hypothetical protein